MARVLQKKENGAVLMDTDIRKKITIRMAKTRKRRLLHTHILMKGGMGMVPFVQAMLLARYLRGDLDEYPVFLWK